jgi:hypothetical protein
MQEPRHPDAAVGREPHPRGSAGSLTEGEKALSPDRPLSKSWSRVVFASPGEARAFEDAQNQGCNI